jgi:hypothetical protein
LVEIQKGLDAWEIALVALEVTMIRNTELATTIDEKNTSESHRIYDEKMAIATEGGLDTTGILRIAGLGAKRMDANDNTVQS